MQFLHQIPPKWYFRPSTSFYPDRGDIEPNEPWRAHVPMGLYQTPVSNPESIFFTCPTIGRLGRSSQKPCLKYPVYANFLGCIHAYAKKAIRNMQIFPNFLHKYAYAICKLAYMLCKILNIDIIKTAFLRQSTWAPNSCRSEKNGFPI